MHKLTTTLLVTAGTLVAAPVEEKVGEIRRFEGHTDLARCVAVSPDGKLALSGGHDKTIRLWDLQTGKPVWSVTAHNGDVRSVAFSPDGKQALSSGQDGALAQWDIKTGKVVRRPTYFRTPVPGAAFSPDGKFALVGLDNQTLQLWDLMNRRSVRDFKGHTSYVVCVAFSPDGKRALSAGSHDKSVRLWEVATGKELRKFEHTEAVHCVAFSPDGKKAVSGGGGVLQPGGKFLPGSDFAIRLWDLDSGKELRRFKGHKAAVWCVAFSPDGKRILSGSGHWLLDNPDKSVRLWDVDSGKELHRFEGHKETVWNVVFTPDGRKAVSCGDKTVRLWSLPEPAPMKKPDKKPEG
jgi:WD40 repeat protein